MTLFVKKNMAVNQLCERERAEGKKKHKNIHCTYSTNTQNSRNRPPQWPYKSFVIILFFIQNVKCLYFCSCTHIHIHPLVRMNTLTIYNIRVPYWFENFVFLCWILWLHGHGDIWKPIHCAGRFRFCFACSKCSKYSCWATYSRERKLFSFVYAHMGILLLPMQNSNSNRVVLEIEWKCINGRLHPDLHMKRIGFHEFCFLRTKDTFQ